VVFIGIDRYQYWLPLQNPVRDCRELAEILTLRYYTDQVVELYDENATKAGIVRLFSDLVDRLKPADSVAIFYSGHGHLDEKSGQAFWIPCDGAVDAYSQDRWLPNTQVLGYLDKMQADHVVLVSDSCFSGDILEAGKGTPEQINIEYFRKAYARVSRQALTSGARETVPDASEFAAQLKLALQRNAEPYLDPLAIFSQVRLGVRKTIPLFGSLAGTKHQAGGSFLFFLRSGGEQPPAAVSTGPGPTTAAGAAPTGAAPGLAAGAAAGAASSGVATAPSGVAAARTGSLYVVTDPSEAELFIDGAGVGRSPKLVENLPVDRSWGWLPARATCRRARLFALLPGD